MRFSLYPLLFVILGTLLFGFAFPIMIAFFMLLVVFVAFFFIFRLLRGGSGFTVYTSRSYREPRRAEEKKGEGRQRVFSSQDSGPRRGYSARGTYINVAADDEEMAEATEVIELPATALRKDNEDETE